MGLNCARRFTYAAVYPPGTPEPAGRLVVERADGPARARGLLARPAPAPGHALRIDRCRSVHSLGMRYPIDVVFLDAGGRVVEVAVLNPWRAVVCRAARDVLELASGEAARSGLVPGARIGDCKSSANGG